MAGDGGGKRGKRKGDDEGTIDGLRAMGMIPVSVSGKAGTALRWDMRFRFMKDSTPMITSRNLRGSMR